MYKLSYVAKELGITKPTLWNWRNSGLIEFHKVGGLNFIDEPTFLTLKSKHQTIYSRLDDIEKRLSKLEGKETHK